jgi:hypothetical protein
MSKHNKEDIQRWLSLIPAEQLTAVGEFDFFVREGREVIGAEKSPADRILGFG